MEEDIPVLPKAAIVSIVKELLPGDYKCANDTKDLLLAASNEFVHLLSSESNEACSKDGKKTINPEHVLMALESLGFSDYLADCKEVLAGFKEETTEFRKNRKQLKDQRAAKGDQNLAKTQSELFAQARELASASTDCMIFRMSSSADNEDAPGSLANSIVSMNEGAICGASRLQSNEDDEDLNDDEDSMTTILNTHSSLASFNSSISRANNTSGTASSITSIELNRNYRTKISDELEKKTALNVEEDDYDD